MILIGESINITSRKMGEAMRNRDKKPIQELALLQEEKGADMLDVNIGPARKEGKELMSWIVETIQEVSRLPLSLDTTNPEAMEGGLSLCRERPLINSASCQEERLLKMLPLASKYDCNIICLLLTDAGLPRDVDERVSLSLNVIERANSLGIPNDRIFIDPVMFTVTVDQKQVVYFREFLEILPSLFDPPCKSTCGLSNVSQGIPSLELRSIMNQGAFCISHDVGIYSAIVNVLDDDFMETVSGIKKEGSVDGYLAKTSQEKKIKLEKTIRILKNESLYCHSWLEL
ncbi:MAG: dihydropteroate synthase [bacterium]